MNLNTFDLRLLRVLDALLVDGSVTRAAARLNLTQSAVSQALSKLRVVLGDPLFVRVGNAMQPTARARAMAQPVREALVLIAAALDEASVFDPSVSTHTFRLAATDHSLLTFFPQLVRRLARIAPRVRLVASSVNPDHGLDYIREGRIDLLVAYFVVTPVPKNFRSRLLHGDTYTVLARTGHPRIRSRLTLDQYAREGHVVVGPRDSWHPGPVDAALARIGRSRDIRVLVPYYLIVPHLIAGADLIATVPTQMARSFLPRLPIRRHPLPLEVTDFRLEMVWDERHHRDPAHLWLREEIGRVAAGDAPP
jgi:DNA-binding transcriptional LysR family regulator